MTGAMYAAIAGLKSHMTKMSVIGNNVANVNTVAYKSRRTVFKDAMYTMYRSGSDGSETAGGLNPSQVGYGSQVSSIDLNMTPGSYTPGNAMDCMIDGDGFFLAGNKEVAAVIDATDPSTFKSLDLTRTGDFGFGADGYLVDGNGSCIYGFMCVGTDKEGEPIISDQLVPLRLPQMQRIPVDANGNAVADENAQGFAGYEYEVKYPVVSANGTNITSGEDLLNAAAANNTVALTNYDDYHNANVATTPADEITLAFAQLDTISIDAKTGRISGTMKDSDQWITIGFLAIGNVTNPNGVTDEGGFYFSAGAGSGDLSISMMGGAAEEVRTVGGGFVEYVNGSRVNTAGTGTGTTTTVELSNKARITSAGTTALITGGLEGSNVDLAVEISDMITTQRGYQANTRIITVTDSMLEELVNMKR